MSVPFHKQTNASKLAGQIVYPLPESTTKQAGQVVNPIPEQFLHQSHKQETTLAQYIEPKTGAITDCDIPKKITFYEWLKTTEAEEVDVDIADAAIIWIAALTKGKL